jgi:hypothetical protein
MAIVVKADEAHGPVNVAQLRAKAVMADPNGRPELIEERGATGWIGHRAKGAS